MTKKTNLKWRLSKLPTPDELRELVKDKIVTQEEAREILFSQEEVEERDKESLEAEIKFLRETIQQLASRDKIVETIRIIEKPYKTFEWYKPYAYWSQAVPLTGANGLNQIYLASGTDSNSSMNYSITTSNTQWVNDEPFGNIKTF